MSKAKKTLTTHLLAAVTPHLTAEPTGTEPPKAVAKTLRKLAKQLLTQPSPPKKGKVPSPAAPTAKQARKALASELTATLQPYLLSAEGTPNGTPKVVAKTIKRLASELLKQNRKQAKQAVKKMPAVVVGSDADKLTLQAASLPPAPARRPAAKRPATRAVAAAPTLTKTTE